MYSTCSQRIPKTTLPMVHAVQDTPHRNSAPVIWSKPCTHSECTLHQISPYIGKLKSSIAVSLVEAYSKADDLVVDPFAGSGTIALEAARRRRRVFASDISPYARVLSKAKLCPPSSLEEALLRAEYILGKAKRQEGTQLRQVPSWVRKFFHPKTLREAIAFARICRESGDEFLLACLLGILHHERPGFLSYPSSHLVPYLRLRKYPRRKFPDLYRYRPLRPRIIAKVKRVYRRFSNPGVAPQIDFRQSSIENVALPRAFDCLVTSPPYMNALDYGRDNRLRLWFIDPGQTLAIESSLAQRRQEFVNAMCCLARKAEQGLRKRGFCVIIVGESFKRSFHAHPSKVVLDIMSQYARSLRLKTEIHDDIPDVRRTRRECKGVKTEVFLVFQKA